MGGWKSSVEGGPGGLGREPGGEGVKVSQQGQSWRHHTSDGILLLCLCQSSTFKAEIPAYRTRQVLSFLIRQEESGRGNGETFPCQEVGEAQRCPRFLAKKNEKVVLTPVLAQSTERGPGGREQDKSPTPAPSH